MKCRWWHVEFGMSNQRQNNYILINTKRGNMRHSFKSTNESNKKNPYYECFILSTWMLSNCSSSLSPIRHQNCTIHHSRLQAAWRKWHKWCGGSPYSNYRCNNNKKTVIQSKHIKKKKKYGDEDHHQTQTLLDWRSHSKPYYRPWLLIFRS